ncbi:hypothetical protein [Shimia aestuarii]|uniref:Mono-oxygenase ydhR n=1 Tax=Shimia aestuarii TaxID=254406 RepID=A0A1I4JCC3_9RHOB|nr:hypothetical protein [Shimia aestuarii]SFL64180.1 hypothetical protein SAMN04488042_101965 [Shimia aestuarii]
MITEIVRFDLPHDKSRAEVVALFEATVARWQSNDRLIRKQYLYDGERGIGGGIYLWPSKADALAAHDTTWCEMAEQVYGSRPSFEYFETPIVVDNAAGVVLHEG